VTVEASIDPLSYAASLLDAVGADREQVPAHIALECMQAAELLDQETFATRYVIDAARAARRALRQLR
jgi:hypothetical protein